MSVDEFVKAVKPANARSSKLLPYLKDMVELRSNGYTLTQVCEYLATKNIKAQPTYVCAFIKRKEKQSITK